MGIIDSMEGSGKSFGEKAKDRFHKGATGKSLIPKGKVKVKEHFRTKRVSKIVE